MDQPLRVRIVNSLMDKCEFRCTKVIEIVDRNCEAGFKADGIENAFNSLVPSKKLVGSFQAKSVDGRKIVTS